MLSSAFRMMCLLALLDFATSSLPPHLQRVANAASAAAPPSNPRSSLFSSRSAAASTTTSVDSLDQPRPFSSPGSYWSKVQTYVTPSSSDASKDPGDRYSHGSVLYDSSSPSFSPPSTPIRPQLIVSHGFTDGEGTSSPGLASVFSLDLLTSTWYAIYEPPPDASFDPDSSTFDHAPPSPRGSHGIALHSGHLYLFGGELDDLDTEDKNSRHRTESGDPIMYRLPLPADPRDAAAAAPVWTRLTKGRDPDGLAAAGSGDGGGDWPTPRSDFSLSVHGDTFLIFGGMVFSNPVQIPYLLNDLHRYDVATNTFTELGGGERGEVPPTRFGHISEVFGDKLLIHGGATVDNRGDLNMCSDMWAFDLVGGGGWEKVEANPVVMRSYHASAFLGNTMWMFGGFRIMETPGVKDMAFVYSDVMSVDVEPLLTQGASTTDGNGIRRKLDVTTPAPEEEVVLQWMEYFPADDTNATYDRNIVRYESTSVIYDGALIIVGGRFKKVQSHCFSLNLTNIVHDGLMAPATEDENYAKTMNMATLHLVIALMVMLILVFIALFGIIQRRLANGLREVGFETNLGGRTILVLSEPHRGAQSQGISSSVIECIPLVRFKKGADMGGDGGAAIPAESDGGTVVADCGAGGFGSDACPICLGEFDEGEDVRLLPCKHIFHPVCVDAWLGQKASCPACRSVLNVAALQAERERETRSALGNINATVLATEGDLLEAERGGLGASRISSGHNARIINMVQAALDRIRGLNSGISGGGGGGVNGVEFSGLSTTEEEVAVQGSGASATSNANGSSGNEVEIEMAVMVRRPSGEQDRLGTLL